MDRLTATLLGAAAVVGVAPALSATAAQASPVPVAATYADLLTPIPNAVEQLRLADAAEQVAQPQLIEAQYNAHHHHHHHHHNRRWYAQHGYIWFNGVWILRPPPHHHHHHHHHQM